MGWANLKYKCPRCGAKLNIHGRYPGDFICSNKDCEKEWELTLEGLWRLKYPWKYGE